MEGARKKEITWRDGLFLQRRKTLSLGQMNHSGRNLNIFSPIFKYRNSQTCDVLVRKHCG